MSDSHKFDRHAPYIEMGLAEVQQLLVAHLPGRQIENITLLTGGFANTNYKIKFEDGALPVVLRIAQRGSGHLETELAVLNRVNGCVPSPRPLAWDFNLNQPFAILEFIGGVALNTVIADLNSKDAMSAGKAVADALAQIHSFALPHAGFFNAEFKFHHVFENFGQGYIDYMRSCLDNPKMKSRLSQDTLSAFRDLLLANGDLVRNLKNTSTLIHWACPSIC